MEIKPKIQKVKGTVQASWNGQLIAESDETLLVEGNHYFPPEAVHKKFLEPNEKHTDCPWKGKASYYDVVVNGERNDGGAWYYPEPFEKASEIKNYIAFWQGIRVIEKSDAAPAEKTMSAQERY